MGNSKSLNKIRNFAKTLRKNQTEVERLLWSKIRNRQIEGMKFRRQVPLNGYIVDFICYEKKIIIELDGGHHNNVHRKEYDKLRTRVLKSKGYKVLRFWNSEILSNMDGTLNFIRSEVVNEKTSSRPSPIKGEGE